MSERNSIKFNGYERVRLVKWKIRKGAALSDGTILFTYNQHGIEKLFKSDRDGLVVNLLASEDDMVSPGQELLEYERCAHTTVMKDLCAECGLDLRKTDNYDRSNASVSMIHSVPELKVSVEQAQELGKADEEKLLRSRKLVLLVDLDQTLIHTTHQPLNQHKCKDVIAFRLFGSNSMLYTKLRPFTSNFLDSIAKYYELHICTFGTRLYAHKIAEILDPEKKLFSHRILSRDECFDPQLKTGNLKALFPCGDSMVCIIDDREDVWNYQPNLISVKPYSFFRNTGDINSPNREKDDMLAKAAKVMSNKQSDEDELRPEKADESPEEATEEAPNEQQSMENEQSNDKEQPKEEAKEDNDKGAAAGEEKGETSGETSGQTSGETSDEKPDEKPNDKPNEKSGETSGENLSENSSENSNSNSNSNEKADEKSDEKSDKKLGETSNQKSNEPVPPEGEADSVDDDDYLLYLLEILKRIHRKFYKEYDEIMKYAAEGEHIKIPDLKNLIPSIRGEVLKGVNIVFTGLIPTKLPPEQSRMWALAKQLGANVSRDLVKEGSPLERTTHLVASNLNTSKVQDALRLKRVHVVNPLWLYACSQRWERVEERLYQLDKSDDFRNPDQLKTKLSFDEQLFLNYDLVKLSSLAKRERQQERSATKSASKAPTLEKLQIDKAQQASRADASKPAFTPFPVYDPVTGKLIRNDQPKESQPPSPPQPSTSGQTKEVNEEEDVLPTPHSMVDMNPLSEFTSQDLQKMNEEVDDACSDEDESESDVGEEEFEVNDEMDYDEENVEYDYGDEPSAKRYKRDVESLTDASSEDASNLSFEDSNLAAQLEKDFLS